MKIFIKIIICLISLTTISVVYAADLKVAVVNIQKVFAASPQAKSADRDFKKEFQPREAKIKYAVEDLQQAIKNYQRNSSVMSSKEKAETEQKLTNQRNNIQQQQAQLQQDMQSEQNKLMQNVLAKIKVSIHKVAKQQKYDLVLQSNTVPYYDSAYDITSKVISDLK